VSEKDKFPYVPGEQFKRADMHKLIGGSFRHGMTMSNKGRDFLLFHDSKNSRKFGYDKWEGLQVDGTFHYSGQGTIGNQSLTRANKGLIEANENSIPIRLIESSGGICTYIGQFVLDEPNYSIEKAPDLRGENERDVFVFKLIPVSTFTTHDKSLNSIVRVEGKSSPWMAPAFDVIGLNDSLNPRTKMERSENRLQAEFGNYLISKGHEVMSHTFSIDGFMGILKPDFWIPSLGILVEAKPSNAREFVRLAIGQSLDYANLSKLEANPLAPAILLPSRPTQDLCRLIKVLGITLIFKDQSNEFVIEPPD
jgi:hypothetical protein